MEKPDSYAGRGRHRQTLINVVRFLKANPGVTAAAVMVGTQLSAPTVRGALYVVGHKDNTTYPPTWTVDPLYENLENVAETIDVELYKQVPNRRPPKAGEFGEQGLLKVWPAWVKAHKSWPLMLTKLSRETDPAKIAKQLDQLAASAATLAQGFRQVAKEPDWVERLGG